MELARRADLSMVPLSLEDNSYLRQGARRLGKKYGKSSRPETQVIDFKSWSRTGPAARKERVDPDLPSPFAHASWPLISIF